MGDEVPNQPLTDVSRKLCQRDVYDATERLFFAIGYLGGKSIIKDPREDAFRDQAIADLKLVSKYCRYGLGEPIS